MSCGATHFAFFLHPLDNPFRGAVERREPSELILHRLSLVGTMLRSGAATPLSRASLRYVSSTSARTKSNLARASTLRKQDPLLTGAQSRASSALVAHKPFSTSLQRYATHSGNPFDKIDKKHEEVIEHEKLVPHPEEVSASSTVHQIFSEKGVEEEQKDEDMLAGVKADLVSFFCFASLGNALTNGAAANYKGDLCSR